MKILYLNNFRGFQKTTIPFKQVNFFVGENSTGKSSILSLLKLMSNTQFWNNDDFNIADIELGFFNELVSNNITGKKCFQIAFHIDEDTEFDRPFKTILVNYENNHGAPKLSKIRLLIKNFNILISVSEKQFRFQIKETNYECNSLEAFQRWIKDKNFEGIKYAVMNQEDDSSFRTPFLEIRSFLRTKLPLDILKGIVRPNFLPHSTWIAPVRSKPKRIYESYKLTYSPEGDHTPLLIKSVLSNQFKKIITKEAFTTSLERFGKNSGLFDKIDIETLGRDLSSPFVLNIFLNKFPLKLTNVGYGVGQVLPLLTEILVSNQKRWFSIQQPEVHLHPRAQAALGEFIYESAKLQMHNFLIETHSDFIIDRYRSKMNQGKSKIESQVLFFERNKKGNTVYPITIDEEGQYSESQPKSFREFFIKEELSLLSI
jgi:predicted ATPase